MRFEVFTSAVVYDPKRETWPKIPRKRSWKFFFFLTLATAINIFRGHVQIRNYTVVSSADRLSGRYTNCLPSDQLTVTFWFFFFVGAKHFRRIFIMMNCLGGENVGTGTLAYFSVIRVKSIEDIFSFFFLHRRRSCIIASSDSYRFHIRLISRIHTNREWFSRHGCRCCRVKN